MKKWFGCICLFVLCLLTGCGQEDKLLQYMDTEELGMINTPEEAERYNRQLDRKGRLKWSYDKQEVEELIRLIQVIKEEAKKEGCSVTEQTLFGEGGVELWMKHASQKIDPTRETMSRPGVLVEGRKKASIQRICAAIEKAGYPEAGLCIKNERSVSRGVRFVYDYYEEDKSYSLDITISDYVGYYPEPYKKILDMLTENQYFISSVQCFGGALNRVVAEKDDEKTLCQEIAILLDKEGNVVEVNVFMADLPYTKVEQKTERKVIAELLTMLTGKREDVSTFVDGFVKKNGEGTIAGDYTWSVQELWDDVGYMLRVQ